MKFHIKRTSIYDDKCPYDKASKEQYIRIDERTIDSPEKFKWQGDKEGWYTKGTNHRVENGHIKRDFIDYDWFVEINTMEELINLKNEVKEELVIRNAWESDMPAIEIYDDYRE